MRAFAVIVVGLALMSAAFVAGSRYSGVKGAGPTAGGERKLLYYTCPMHPQYRSSRPGDAPCCGMRLEPVYSDGSGKPGAPRQTAVMSPVSGALYVSPEKQQMIGVKIGRVEVGSAPRLVRLPGRVAVDESRVVRLVAGTTGLVRELKSITSGTMVTKDQVLATYYSREFLPAQQTYLLALGARDPAGLPMAYVGPNAENQKARVEYATDQLEALGMSRAQIANMAKTAKLTRDIEIRSPVTGLVLERSIYPDQKFDRGADFFKIADVSQMWVLADVFENEPWFIGRQIQATIRYQGRVYKAASTSALPQLDTASRAIRIRLDVSNHDLSLRPGALVDVECMIRLPKAITVPVDAVVDSGLHQRVFVARGGGYFEARTVETGWRMADRIAINKGLKPGDRIVTAGNFLLDSESRMKDASAGTGAGAPAPKAAGKLTDPVCGMTVDPDTAAGRVVHAGVTYYFCSKRCEEQFMKEPSKYTAKSARG